MYIKRVLLLKIFFVFLFTFTANAYELRIVTNESPPTTFTKDNGKISGISVDIVEEIKKYLNIQTQIEIYPWARSYHIAKNEPNIIIFSAAKTQERMKHGFHFIGPIITRKHLLWTKKENDINIRNLQDIKDKKLKLGALRGDFRYKFFKNRKFDIQEASSHEQNLKKLLRNRFDLWVSSDIEGPQVAKKLDIDIKRIKQVFVFKEASSYIMISNDTPQEIIKEWEVAFKRIQQPDFFKKKSKEWSGILGYKLGYSNEKGFYVK